MIKYALITSIVECSVAKLEIYVFLFERTVMYNIATFVFHLDSFWKTTTRHQNNLSSVVILN